MTFKRGQNAKKAMNVGITTNAIEIVGIAEFIMQANGKEYVPIEDEEKVIAILRQLQLNKYGSNPNDIKLIQSSTSINMWGSKKKILGKISINESYTSEKVVEYKGKFYVIPIHPSLWARWQDVQYTRSLYRSGHFTKA